MTTSRKPLQAGSQAEKILAHLARGNTLTIMEAIRRWDCTTLSQRCTELKRRGHPIRSTMVTLRSGKRVAQYTLKGRH